MGAVDAIEWACVLCGHHIKKWLSKYSNESVTNFVLSLNIPLWKLFRWFRRPQLRATDVWHLHHNNAPAHISYLLHSFLVKHQITQVTQTPWTQIEHPVILTFPKTKITFEREEISALLGVAQWIEHWPANWEVAGLIPSEGTCLGCRPGPQSRVCERQTIDVSPAHWCSFSSLSPAFLSL